MSDGNGKRPEEHRQAITERGAPDPTERDRERERIPDTVRPPARKERSSVEGGMAGQVPRRSGAV